MDSGLNKNQLELVNTAERVARECLAPRAHEVDASGTNPKESWQDVWQNGLLAIGVPKEYGGLGLDMLTYVMVIEKLAGGCTNTGMTVHMHSTVMRFIEALGTDKQKAAYYPEVVDEGKLYGSWGSEPETRGGTAMRFTTITPDGDGYVINGIKHFCTMAGGAHRYMIHCNAQNSTDALASQQLALVPHDAAGLSQLDEWNTLGMRGTVSPSMKLDKCVIPQDAVLGEPGAGGKSGVTQGFSLGFAAAYVGAAQAALDCTKEFCLNQTFAPDPGRVADGLVVQRTIAEMSMAMRSAQQALYDAASQWEGKTPNEKAVLGARAKYLATIASLEVSSKAIQIAGGRSAHKRMPLERIFRDIRTSTLMPPNMDRCLELIGRAEFELDTPLNRDS
ncbi:MAG: acyl-CoA/acyl-ACP dehydrogenase [SAR202 cluster bacterium]|nr:acyl-CoA/acyl-ACP dehydrogenase [SAR202 cluster bacterium]